MCCKGSWTSLSNIVYYRLENNSDNKKYDFLVDEHLIYTAMSVHLGYWFGMKVTEAEKVEMLVNKDVIVRQSLPPTPDTTSLHEHHIFYQVMDRKNLS